jgi:hypothetical protein
MPWTTCSSHPDEQQARSAGQRLFTTDQGTGPLTVDAVEIRGPQGDWQPLFSTTHADSQPGQHVAAGHGPDRPVLVNITGRESRPSW